MRPTAAELAATLGLEPHPEGGFFRETYRAAATVQTPRGERAASTAILFLVTAAGLSHLHRIRSDELWVFQGGLPLELVTLAPGGELETRVLGDPAETGRTPVVGPHESDPASAGEVAPAWTPQALVSAGSWQGARLAGGPHLPASRAWALVSCIVSPGFEYEDFELGERDALLAAYPGHAAVVTAFT
ncbi:MAG: cupin domain-containing protein [Actinomycetes bacterium]